MRNMFTIFRRELAAYFNSPIGAIFLIVFTLIASGLFVTEFFLFPVAELRSFFNILPFIFCVFVPAVTMRLWAEERAGNTVEMLLTFPMSPVSLVLGKYLAGLCFLLLALGSTLLLPVMVAALGEPDLGQMAASYLGAVLLGAFFLALGQLVSGFAKDQIVAFVLSLLACFALFLLGTSFAATALDAWISGLGSTLRELLGVTGHYEVFTRGIVEMADLAYFLVWTLLFLFLNAMFIEGRGRKAFASIFTVCASLCLGIGLTFNALISDMTLGRFDWTEGKIHTVSDATRSILADLKAPVQITYYVTPEEDMPTEIKTLERDVMDRLEELRLAGHGMIAFKRVHMRAANVLGGNPFDQEEQKGDPLEKRMLEKGIEPFSVSALRQTGSVSNLIYSSIGVAYKDKPEEIIPRIVPDALGELEYALVSTVFRLTRDRQPVVAMAGEEQFNLLRQVLEQEKYQVRPVALHGDQTLPADADVLLILNPMHLGERQVWDLREALASGRKTILAVQTSQWDYNMDRGQIAINRMPMETGLDDFLAELGLAVEQKVLMDEQNIAIRVARSQVDQLFGGGMNLKLPIQIVLTKDNMNPNDPITSGMDNVFYLWGAALNVNRDAVSALGLEATVLASSSPRSWLAEVPMTLTQPLITPPTGGLTAYPVAVRLSGQFPANTGPAPARPDAEETSEAEERPVSRENRPGELIVIGGAAMFGDNMLQNNVDLIMNAVDSMAHGPDLIRIRGKKAPSRVILDVSPESATLWKFMAYCLPTLAIAGLAAIRAWTRQRRRVIFAQTMRSLS
jgi:ABC-type transport system involved in multi-copper enzyme maturation permease subunit